MRPTPLLILLALGALSACAGTDGQGSSGDEVRMVKLAQDLQNRGDYDTATMLYERAAAVSKDSVRANIRLGQALLDAHEPERAATTFRNALNTAPDNGEALLGLGTAQLQAGQVEGAARSLAAAAPILKTAAAYNRLGTALILSGDTAGAITAFNNAARIEPANLDTQSNLALAESISGQSAPAITRLREITASPRAERRHFHNLMIAYILAGQDSAAEAVVIPDYSASEKKAFLAEARKVRGIKTTAGRAKAIGLLSQR